MVIRIADIVKGADTQAQGACVHEALCRALSGSASVTVSFEGIDTATSSFVNVSFARLLDRLSLNDIKTRIRVVKSTKQINDMIRRRLERSASVVA